MKKLLVIPLLFLSLIALCQPASVKTRPLKDSNVFIANTLYVDRAVSLATPTDASLSFSDILTNNASITKHGFLPKLPNDATKYLNGLGNWVTVTVSPGIDDVLAQLQQLTTDRTIRGGNHNLILDSGTLKFTHVNGNNPAILLDPFPTLVHGFQYILRAKTASTTNVMPFEMAIDNNANGGPPDDNIVMEGWNIDSRSVPGEASFTTRMESKFQGGNYEYHLQFSQDSRLYRLMSFTFRNFGDVPHDEDLLFFTVSGMEIRNLAGNGVWSAGGGTTAGPDVTTMSMTNRASSKQVVFSLDDLNNAYTLQASAGSLALQFSNFTIADFGPTPIKTTGGLINNFFAPPASGSTYTFESGSSDMTIFWIPSHVSSTAYTIVSGNTGGFEDHFNSGGGWFRGFFAGSALTLKLDNFGATVSALPFNVAGSTSLNITSDGATSPIGGAVNSALRMIASVPAQFVGPYYRNTSTTGGTEMFMENNRGAFANYMFFRLEGATSTIDNGLFGITTAADWLMLAGAGASNAGFLIGNFNASPLVFATNNIQRARFDGSIGLLTMTASRFAETKGASVASAGDLTLGTDGNTFHITGTTTINAITIANWQDGAVIALIFDGSLTVKNNTAGGGGTAVFKLNGGVDFSATADDQLVLKKDGARWLEQSRSVN